MPTKKQRRRREKELRHEWEEVYVDSEGRELAPEEVDELLPAEPSRRSPTRATTPARQKPGAGPSGAGKQRAGGRIVQPPSWRRVLKRGAIFAPLMYVFIALTSHNRSSVIGAVLMTVYLLLIFLPFSYLMDSLTYRLWKKRQAKPS